jgi:hypothetical protein
MCIDNIMKEVFGLNYFVFCILVLVVVLYFTRDIRDEGFFVSPGVFDQLASTESFGMSPGTMDQLASTRVVSKREQDIDQQIYDNLTRQGIINMTESGYKGSDFASTAGDY